MIGEMKLSQVNAVDASYIPLNGDNLHNGARFGPIKFRIKCASHAHHLDYLRRENKTGCFPFEREFLFPFEMFPLPRVLSKTFKRLNEILSIKCERKVHRLPPPHEELFAHTIVEKIFKKRGLCFAVFKSYTFDEEMRPLMSSVDKALLINDSDRDKLRALIINRRPVSIKSVGGKLSQVGEFTLGFRYTWDESVWVNNIHTDTFAKSLGFNRGLIEAPAFMDVLLSGKESGMLLRERTNIAWQYFAPLDYGVLCGLYMSNQEGIKTLWLVSTDSQNILMKIDVETL